MKNKHITIKDIAHKLNIHHTTVSKALRNHPDISLDTRKLIRKTAKELDYHPNTLAQSFKNQRSKTIGVCVPAINVDFFSDVISGIQNIVYKEGYTLIVCQSNEMYDREVLDTRALISNQVAGLIISISQTTRNSEHLKIFERRNIPLVFFDRKPPDIKANYVVLDDFKGALQMVENLINWGYKRIAHLAGPPYISVSKDRKNGYVAALQKYDLPVDEELIVYGNFDQHSGDTGVKTLFQLNKTVDAILAVNDIVAAGAYIAIKERGLRIPGDIALAGFGNTKISSLLDPPLTTVQQWPSEMGEFAARMIIDQIKNPDDYNELRTRVLEPKIIVRKST